MGIYYLFSLNMAVNNKLSSHIIYILMEAVHCPTQKVLGIK